MGSGREIEAAQAIEKWMQEVCDYINSLQEQLQKKETCRNLYYGFSVIDGHIIYKPEILFIGINPPRSIGRKNHPITLESGRLSYMDHLDKLYHYQLASENIDLFSGTGKSDAEVRDMFENRTVRSYLFYMCTAIQLDMKYCLDLLGHGAYREFYAKSMYFTSELIRMLEPKVVIFEGKTPYQAIVRDCMQQRDTWDKEHHVGYYHDPETGTHYIGYKRAISTIISDKAVLRQTLRKVLHETQDLVG
jgi:hypothetical protein